MAHASSISEHTAIIPDLQGKVVLITAAAAPMPVLAPVIRTTLPRRSGIVAIGSEVEEAWAMTNLELQFFME